MGGRKSEATRGNREREEEKKKTEYPREGKDPVSGQQTVSLKGKKNNRMMKDGEERWGEGRWSGKMEDGRS